MKQQVVVIHGGETFNSRNRYLTFLRRAKIDFQRYARGKSDWKKNLGRALGKKYQVILPDMPNKLNAKYAEWKIWFQKFLPHLQPNVILGGHSLGGIFLVKYLAQNKFPRKIRAVFLVAAPYTVKNRADSLADFALPRNMSRLDKLGAKIFLYHSRDDKAVPYANLEKYRRVLPRAVARTFRNRGHFNQSKLPELVRDIKTPTPN